ncbi:MAG: hypothetical protein AAF191_06280 [Verrucomicrobiota bacterium]
MKRAIALTASLLLFLAPLAPVQAGEVEKEPLSFEEITSLMVEEKAEASQIAQTEAGMEHGGGLLVLGIVGLILVVALAD